MRTTLILFIALFLSAGFAMAQEWEVPEAAKKTGNPLPYNLENVKKGKALYIQNCKSCHGDPGKNNALPLVPPPPDIASKKMQNNSDGALFYKITHGRGGMPQFETTISEDDRWRLVNYIRNFNPNNEPLLVDAPPKKVKIAASIDEAQKIAQIEAKVEESEGKWTPLANTEISVGAKKAFGVLPLGKTLTDAEGKARYSIPENLIGDENGVVTLVFTPADGFVSEQIAQASGKVGQAKPTPKLIHKGALWSTNENVPMWILLSYLAATLGAWITIGYVMLQIFKIWKLGKSNSSQA